MLQFFPRRTFLCDAVDNSSTRKLMKRTGKVKSRFIYTLSHMTSNQTTTLWIALSKKVKALLALLFYRAGLDVGHGIIGNIPIITIYLDGIPI